VNLRQLETFLWIARLGSIDAAARKLGATQSTVSMRLLELEKELGVELVDRRRRPRRLTARGRRLVPYAQRLLALTDTIRVQVGTAAMLSGAVRIGVAEHIALTWLPELVSKLNRRHPDVTVELEVGLLDSMAAQLRADELDIVLTATLDNHDPGLVYRSLGTVRFAWMANPAANAALRLPGAPISPRILSALPVVTMTRPSILHQLMERWFASAGTRPRRVDICNSLSACAGLTRAGLGVGLLPSEYAAQGGEDASLVELQADPPFPATRFHALYSTENAPPLAPIVAEMAVKTSTFPRAR